MISPGWNRTKKWLIPLVVAIGAFAISQAALFAFTGILQDNPLPIVFGTIGKDEEGSSRNPSSDIVISDKLQAEVIVESAGISVPIVWSTSTNEVDLQKDLETGSIHYPGTPEPGKTGNAFITAHSSDYPWKKGEYKTAFSKLGKVNVGDTVTVIYKKNDKPVYKLNFRVKETKVVKATDQRMVEQGETSEVTLVTCWPLGTNFLRLMVKADLVDSIVL